MYEKMSKFSFVLVFTLFLFDCIFQGNAVVTNTTPENSNVTKESGSQSISNSNVQQPSENTGTGGDEETENVQWSTEAVLSSSSESIEDNYNDEEISPDEEKRTDLSTKENAAFTLIQEFDKKYKSYHNSLPTISKKTQGRWRLSSIYSEQTEEIHLCPNITVESDSRDLRAAYEENPVTRSCLFRKEFEPDEPKICTKSPIPWLTIQKNSQPHEDVPYCNKSNQHLLAFEYNDCDSLDYLLLYGENALIPPEQDEDPFLQQGGTLKVPFIFKATYRMYEICYDFQAHKTLWTKHQILQPMLIYDPTIPTKNEESINLDAISTETFDLPFLPPHTFIDLKNIYQKQHANMNAEYLVPMQHMVMQNWKKSTQHLINTAPLQDKFHHLLHTIDQGLVKASYHTFIHTGVVLQIFTAAETELDAENNFLYNTWYKFIYNQDNKSGVLISLDNVSDKLFTNPTCKNDLQCQFNKWDEPEADIQEDVLAHAGCCVVTPERVKELFHTDVKINHPMDIHKIVLNCDITDTRLHYLENHNIKKPQSSQRTIQHAKPTDAESNKDDVREDDSRQEESFDKFIEGGDGNTDKDSHQRPSLSPIDFGSQIKDPNEEKRNVLDKAKLEEKESHDVQGSKVVETSKNDGNTEPNQR